MKLSYHFSLGQRLAKSSGYGHDNTTTSALAKMASRSALLESLRAFSTSMLPPPSKNFASTSAGQLSAYSAYETPGSLDRELQHEQHSSAVP
eukprot:SAG31_NODE_4118_length_3565_cov_2.083670_6_plen_92_part_00